jgi:hypothetical protein
MQRALITGERASSAARSPTVCAPRGSRW